MAQEKTVGAGAFVDLNGGDIGAAGRVAKAFLSGAAVRFRDLPEELRRQLGGVDGRAGHGFLTTGAIRDYAKLSVLRFDDDDDEKVVYQKLDASSHPPAPENVGGGLVEQTNVFPAWVEVSGVLRLDAAAFARGPSAPFADKEQLDKNDAAGLDLGALSRRGVVFVPDDADTLVEKLLGNNRADEHGAPYSDGSGRSPYDVQVLVEDPAVGAKADDPIAQVAKAAGARAERESTRYGVGGDNLSAVLGIVAASSAVTAVATGAVGPAVAFGFFLVMLGGVVAAMAAVRGP